MKTATVVVIVGLFVFPGCAQRSEVYHVLPGPPSNPLLNKLRHLYPERFTMYHRVILTVRGKNYDFNGYVTRAAGDISAVGFNDLGGRLFHITSAPQKVEVLSKPDRMPAKVLRNGVGQELSAMFCASISNARSVQSMSNRIVLIDERRNIEYIFSSSLQRCHTIIISEGSEKISVIQLRDYQMFAGWNQDVPQTIAVFNRKWNYQMTLRLLQIKPS